MRPGEQSICCDSEAETAALNDEARSARSARIKSRCPFFVHQLHEFGQTAEVERSILELLDVVKAVNIRHSFFGRAGLVDVVSMGSMSRLAAGRVRQVLHFDVLAVNLKML